MGFLDKLKELLKRNNDEFNFEYEEDIQVQPTSQSTVYQSLDLPNGELVPFTDEVLDTNSKETIEKFKHNLVILAKKVKETGKVDQFKLIREDNNFPFGWEWDVLSSETSLDQVTTQLSTELRMAYALEQSGVSPYEEVFGEKIPRDLRDPEITEALSKVDKNFAAIMLSSKFRSTKHFTINTPLGSTLDTNLVATNRNFTIIDDIDAFLSSGYGYSVAYRDAYLDVAHESLPISKNAVVLINDEKYQQIISDEDVARELAQRRVIRYKGDEIVATNMILTEMGALPYRVGRQYLEYDNEVQNILDTNMQKLAEENGLLYQQIHFGKTATEGHFSSYFDSKNNDFAKNTREFIAFLRRKFPEHEQLLSEQLIFTERSAKEIVEQIGTAGLIEAITEYNKFAQKKLIETQEAHKQDRQNITPETHQLFVDTVSSIQEFYQSPNSYANQDAARGVIKFMQSKTVSEQLKAAKILRELLPKREERNATNSEHANNQKQHSESQTITMENATRNALLHTTAEQVQVADKVAQQELNLEHTREGVSK